jgi:DNA-binding transcriptional LysR family regulator
MQLESLKIFCDVVRWASFSRGAAENGISQSSASQAVHQLEVRLGVKLIDRSKRPLVLTPPGKVYHEGCKDLVDRYLELENRVKALEDVDTVVGTVGVAAIYSVGLNHMSQYVKSFEERHHGASVRLEYLHPSRVLERVTNGEAELGLLSFPRKWPDLNVVTWREEAMVLTVHPSHRFARRPSISVAELEGEAFVGFDPDLSIRRAIDRYLRRHEVQVDVVLEFDNIENIKRAVEIPSGISILPEPSLAQEVKAGSLVAVPIEGTDPNDRITRPLAIIHRRQAILEPAAARFLDLLIGADASGKTRTAVEPKRVPASVAP